MRVLFEWLFPSGAWLSNWWVAGLIGLLLAGAGGFLTRRAGLGALAPLLLNVVVVSAAAGNPIETIGTYLLALWLTAALWVTRRRPAWTPWLLLGLLPFYLGPMATTVGAADTFEFQVTAPRLGIAHPTGYPLYLLLGKAWTSLPFGTVAWRLNLGSAAYALLTAWLLYNTLYHRLAPVVNRVPEVAARERAVSVRAQVALLPPIAFGLAPTFWSQAIVAEVYALHALFVAGTLWLIGRIDDGGGARWTTALAAWLGLGLTNHLTTLLLLPAVAVALLWQSADKRRRLLQPRRLAGLAGAFLAPLLLYAYLPLRWQAVNGEPMGAARFIDWVIGGRFQAALQWDAWLRDPTRYAVVGRLFLQEWSPELLGIAGIGLVCYAWLDRRWAVITGLIALVTTFYTLNYYVPDLAVFLLPAQLMVALWLAATPLLLPFLLQRLWWHGDEIARAAAVILVLGFGLRALSSWEAIAQPAAGVAQQWGAGVLARPLAADAAILADSDKFPPLYYLQQAEGVRPDLDIAVLPDEAAYRAAIADRLAAGQTVYLARYLPRLPYALRSAGPLVEIVDETAPAPALPASATPLDGVVGPLTLRGFEVTPSSPLAANESALTLYWQTVAPVDAARHVYVRVGDNVLAGQHPVNNMYPTNAWRPGALVTDFYRLPLPARGANTDLPIAVAVAPPFTDATTLAWQTVTTLSLPPTAATAIDATPIAVTWSGGHLSGVQLPQRPRPGQPIAIVTVGDGMPAGTIGLTGADGAFTPLATGPGTTVRVHRGSAPAEAGPVTVELRAPDGGLRCGFLQRTRTRCVLGTFDVAGVALPANAVNFDDRIALLSAVAEPTTLTPSGVLDVTLTWQALAALSEDYTVFVQVIDAADRIVGQIDAWPLQGTFPTSQWVPGETVTDPYRVPLSAELAPGEYRLLVGWYLLRDLRRLPVLDADGRPIDDKYTLPGFSVAP